MAMHALQASHTPVPTVALRLFRLSVGLTQTKLGKEVHIPAAEIGYMEQGRLIPTPDQAKRLSDFFGVAEALLFKRVDLVELLQHI